MNILRFYLLPDFHVKSMNLTEQADQHIDTDTEELFQVKFSYGKANLVVSD